ncbi:hypothetical protein CYLTODRAFT_417588 [Cylindrobasidium torrendii FP15055 ss-10]|uniref:Neuroguidin n=1 Tax=Cylindrobasidium torrendii FP15055 ss-10 TaxID=1314674 RepID=A0A0D7BT85_9AGAR|nr:hypothetical protein CYLTODRAFT_417588 [Cylindrobasidium torrendii FP15055 ss-10]
MSDEQAGLTANFQEITQSIASARSLIQDLKSQSKDTNEGISLLSLKNQLLLSYIQSLLLLSCRRALGHNLSTRNPPEQPFDSLERDARGGNLGDLVDSMIEGRMALEKAGVLQERMRYQIDKLVCAAKEDSTDVTHDALAFRPNPANLVDNDDMDSDEEEEAAPNHRKPAASDGIYRAPRLAPVPYIPTATKGDKQKRDRTRAPIPTTLAALRDADPDMPYIESTSGLGSTPGLNAQSSRARYLKHLNEFEEGQFGRVLLTKKEERRRLRDEETLAMGGSLAGVGEEAKGRVRRHRYLEDEFDDVLRDVDRATTSHGDGYEELRERSKRAGVLERSRKAPRVVHEDDDAREGGGKRKRSRFESERKAIKKRK